MTLWSWICLGQRRTRNLDSCFSVNVLRRYHTSDFFLEGDAIFLKIVAWPARPENHLCSHPRTGDATAEKNREKFNELYFSRQNHELCNSCSHHRALATRQFSKRDSHHHREQKNARTAAALLQRIVINQRISYRWYLCYHPIFLQFPVKQTYFV